ncbi:hypothetical protein ACFY93_25225 [Streptomyces sp. NPDC008313]|uniref:hypothetical protein n=1 Tax=Streptomyces sp. NPDC008313 TaxID=3364826 RepID=UPI0036F06C2F
MLRPRDDALARARDAVRSARERQLRGRYAEATVLADAALVWARRAGAEPERTAALRVLGVSLWQGPEPAAAAAHRIRALLAEHGAGRPAARLALTGPLAVLYGMRERWAPARGALDLTRATAMELDPEGGALLLSVLTARVESLAGRTRQAARLLRTAADAADVLGVGPLRDAVRWAGVRLLGDAGRYGEAAEWIPGPVPHAPAAGRDGDGRAAWPGNADRAAGTVARIAAVRGDAGEASVLADLALEAAAASDSPVAQAMVRLDQAEVFRLTGRRDEARRAVCLAGGDFARKGHVPGVSDAAARHAALASAALPFPSASASPPTSPSPSPPTSPSPSPPTSPSPSGVPGG